MALQLPSPGGLAHDAVGDAGLLQAYPIVRTGIALIDQALGGRVGLKPEWMRAL